MGGRIEKEEGETEKPEGGRERVSENTLLHHQVCLTIDIITK